MAEIVLKIERLPELFGRDIDETRDFIGLQVGRAADERCEFIQ